MCQPLDACSQKFYFPSDTLEFIPEYCMELIFIIYYMTIWLSQITYSNLYLFSSDLRCIHCHMLNSYI